MRSETTRSSSTRRGLDDELAELALGGAGWQSILSHLARAAGTSARLIGVHGAPLAAADARGQPVTGAGGVAPGVVSGLAESDEPTVITCSDGWAGAAVALRAGARRVGLLALEHPIDDARHEMLLAARVPVCIEAVRRDAEAETRSESASRLIDEVRFGVLRPPDEVRRVAERFRVLLDRPHVATVFSYEGSNQRTWTTALSWIEMPVRREGTRGWTILEPDSNELTRIRTRLQGMVGDDAPVLAATGSAVADVHDTPRSFFEAEVALGLLRRRPGERELRFATLGVTGLMLSVPRDRLRDFVNRHLGPIADREDLLDTLAAWLDTNGSRVAVARQLGLHRNSVGYRMGRIRVALKHNPFDASDALQLRVALAAREVLAVLDELAASERGEPVNPRPPRGERWPIA